MLRTTPVFVEAFEKRVVYDVEDGFRSAADAAPPSGAPPPRNGLRPPSEGTDEPDSDAHRAPCPALSPVYPPDSP